MIAVTFHLLGAEFRSFCYRRDNGEDKQIASPDTGTPSIAGSGGDCGTLR
jgi:hypothetical protein